MAFSTLGHLVEYKNSAIFIQNFIICYSLRLHISDTWNHWFYWCCGHHIQKVIIIRDSYTSSKRFQMLYVDLFADHIFQEIFLGFLGHIILFSYLVSVPHLEHQLQNPKCFITLTMVDIHNFFLAEHLRTLSLKWLNTGLYYRILVNAYRHQLFFSQCSIVLSIIQARYWLLCLLTIRFVTVQRHT